MIDAVQLVLLIVIAVLTVLLVVLGIQVFFILVELRKTVEKANKVLDNAGSIAESVTGPISSISSFATGVKSGSIFSVAKFVKNLLAKDDDEAGKKKRKEE